MQSLADLTPCETPSTTPAGQRILESVAQLFYTHGISRTGVDLIANEADVTKRTLYQRFGSKDALVAAYLQQRAHGWQTYLLEGLSACDGDALGCLYRLVADWASVNTRGCAFVNAWVEMADGDHPALRVIRAEKQWMHELFEVLASGETELAQTWYLLYEGAQVSAALHDTTQPFDDALRASRGAAAARR